MNCFIVDPGFHGITAEDAAMLMALYSRSAASVVDNLEKVRKAGSGKFMDQYYCGYGHKSIGDCGDTDLYFEGISMLAAKAIQDHPLYRGQETSSRYLNFLERPLIDPLDLPALHKNWMNLYERALQDLPGHLRLMHPLQEGEDEALYERTIKARAFDVARGLLPAGVTTQVGWSTDLRQAADRLIYLTDHPVPEIALMALKMFCDLQAHYKNSFNFDRRLQEGAAYRKAVQERHAYWDPDWKDLEHFSWSTNIEDPLNFETQRPRGEELPYFLNELGHCRAEFLVDFGSFRDLQRHRPGVCRMPLLTTRYGFETWYRDMLPEHLQLPLTGMLHTLDRTLSEIPGEVFQKQFYVPMGFRVPCRLTRGLPGMVYMAELRTGKTVHPTVRPISQRIARCLEESFPGIGLHVDYDAEDWSLRRGGQDLVKK